MLGFIEVHMRYLYSFYVMLGFIGFYMKYFYSFFLETSCIFGIVNVTFAASKFICKIFMLISLF